MRVEVVAAVRVWVVAAVRVWVVWLGCGGAGWGFCAEWPTQAGLHARHHINPSQAVGGVRGWIAEKRGKVVFSRSLFLSLYEKIMV